MRVQFRTRFLLLPTTAACVLLITSLAAATPPSRTSIDEVDGIAIAQLERVRAFLNEGQWSDAIETLLAVVSDQGDRLRAVPDPAAENYAPYMTLRDYSQWLLCNLPPEHLPALRWYRRRTDTLARRWFETGVAERDEALLQQIVDELFPSSVGDDAAAALAEMALERGHYTTARNFWERTHPALRTGFEVAGRSGAGRPWWGVLRRPEFDPNTVNEIVGGGTKGAMSPWLAYPDTDLKLADLRARLVLTSILEGAEGRARAELAVFRDLHPHDEGWLGGRTVTLSDALEQLLEEHLGASAPRVTTGWSTFAGNFSRQGIAPGFSDVMPQSVWKVNFSGGAEPAPGGAGADTNQRQGAESPRGWKPVPRVFPVVHAGRVFICDGASIRALDVANGRSASPVAADGEVFPASPLRRPPPSSPRLPAAGTPRYTMSIVAGRLFARMGDPATVLAQPDPTRPAGSFLLGLDLQTWKSIFRVAPPDYEWAFEGAPVADEQRVYIAARRSQTRPQQYVLCYDLAQQRELWRRLVCATAGGEGGGGGGGGAALNHITHNLLSLHEETLYLNTNQGVVAAIRAADGVVKWVTRYPRRERTAAADRDPPQGPVEPSPCLVHRGSVYVAPLDCPQVFALDAASGLLCWHTNFADTAFDGGYLLGVVENQLIIAGNRVWWVDIRSGELSADVPHNPFPPPAGTGPVGFGRGLLAGNLLYWPARGAGDRIYVLDPRTGVQPRQPISLFVDENGCGNLVPAGDRLLVAGPQSLLALPARLSNR